jgi:type I restriction enzyme, R subunit
MPNAVFIGFTGTHLLKEDKQTSLEVFGRHIHTFGRIRSERSYRDAPQ